MIVLVCGAREYPDTEFLFQRLSALLADKTVDLLIHGGATGADSLAGYFAKLQGWPVKKFLADWVKHGRAAGPLRNKRMLEEGKPDLIIAFPAWGKDNKGTNNMIEQGSAAGVEVIVVQPRPREPEWTRQTFDD